jgi:exosortase A
MVQTPSTITVARSGLPPSVRDWLIIGAAIAATVCAFGLMFLPEIETAVQVWFTDNAYNHCLLVIPVAAYLAWDRRHAIAATRLRPTLWVVLLAIPVSAAWFVANRLGTMEGRQLTALALVQVALASILGLQAWRVAAAPLLYLFFLIPFGEFLVPPLQYLVAHFTTVGLDLLNIPNVSDGIVIQIPEGTFLIHQACSGLRFLIASLAFGVLYACIMYTTRLRRIAFIALAVFFAIFANCLRVLGIVMIAHFVGDAESVEANHILWGWLFYVIVGLALVLVGLVFRQAPQSPKPTSIGINRRHIAASTTLIVLSAVIFFAAIPRVVAEYLDSNKAGVGDLRHVELPILPGCAADSVPPDLLASSSVQGTASSQTGAYRCGGDLFVVALIGFPPRIGVRPLFLTVRGQLAPSGWDIISDTGDFNVGNGPNPMVWRITMGSNEHGYAAVAAALLLGGRPEGTGFAARIRQARNTIDPGALPPVLLVVTHFGGNGPNEARQALNAFLPKAELLFQAARDGLRP